MLNHKKLIISATRETQKLCAEFVMSDQAIPLECRANFYSSVNVYDVLPWLVRAFDFFACMLGFSLLPVLFELCFYNISYDAQSYMLLGVVFALFYVFYAEISGLYNKDTILNMPFQFKGIFLSWFFSWVFFIITAFALKTSTDFSRVLVGVMMFSGAPILMFTRLLFRNCLSRAKVKGIIRKENALMLCVGQVGNMLTFLNANYNIVESQFLCPKDLLEKKEKFFCAFQNKQFETLILVIPFEYLQIIPKLLPFLSSSPVTIRLVTDGWVSSFIPESGMGIDTKKIENLTVINLTNPPMTVIERIAKRGFDAFFAAIALILLSPLMILTAIAVKIESSGPVLFKQKRLGFNNKEFSILKFRSMTVMENGENIVQAKYGDSRVTRVGKIIRAASLDELPQLINVLAGHMSIVGPRPHALAHDRYYGDIISDYSRRRHMKPGLTGWAQIHGLRGETANITLMESRVEHDLWYIRNWSLWLDVWIILRTIKELVINRNVY